MVFTIAINFVLQRIKPLKFVLVFQDFHNLKLCCFTNLLQFSIQLERSFFVPLSMLSCLCQLQVVKMLLVKFETDREQNGEKEAHKEDIHGYSLILGGPERERERETE